VHKAADYIKYLQRTNLVTIEKWRDEKKETDDKIKSLQEHVERLERELEAARAANEPKRRKVDP
jgi:predicted  nucleic acid-binding Zn-ribbon protein